MASSDETLLSDDTILWRRIPPTRWPSGPRRPDRAASALLRQLQGSGRRVVRQCCVGHDPAAVPRGLSGLRDCPFHRSGRAGTGRRLSDSEGPETERPFARAHHRPVRQEPGKSARRQVRVGHCATSCGRLSPSCRAYSFFNSSAIEANCSRAVCKSSAISCARTSGSGKSSESSRLLSLSQKMSRLSLSRLVSSS